ncbi:MAG: hypothetical protein AAF630_04605 [Cyanobacteria bacterium P01_C01_bin.38]
MDEIEIVEYNSNWVNMFEHREAYTEGKSDYIRGVMEKARQKLSA